MASERMTYLPALDGLRAIAVTMVVAYHLDAEWARGGFLGVDLFFVISGFLITTLLLREHDSTGRIALGSFWTRRFRRLVPPLVVMTAATVAATRVYSLPEQWSSIRWDAAAAVGYVANWRFVLDQQSYFETLLGPSPLRHTWSLAVEEQWYVLWPAVVLGLLLLSRSSTWRRWIPTSAIVAGTAASALLMAVLYDPVDPTRVYFGTDTRAQQLLVGAGLAWLSSRHRLPTAAHRGRTVSVLVSVALVGFTLIAATTSDRSAWLYHGGFVAVSLLCAVIVWAVADTDGPLTWLGVRPLVWIGTRSYAIYLWHWPVIIFVGAPMGLELARLPLAVLQVALTLLLAELSFRVVERPIRTSTLRPALLLGGWTAISAATALVAVLLLVPPEGRSLDAVEVVRPSAAPTTSGPTTTPTTTTRNPPPATETVTGDSVPSSSVDSMTPAEPSTVLLLGDSTALSLAERRTLDPGPEWNIQAFARLGCSISEGNALDVGSDVGIIQGEGCSLWRTEWADAYAQVDPDVTVVMVGAWEVLDHIVDGVAIRFPDPAWFDVVTAGVRESIEIAGADETPVALLAVPCMRQAPNTILSTIARNDPARVAAFNEILRQEAARNPNVHVIDLNDRLCPEGTYLDEVDGALLRYDGVHVTTEGANYVWTWLLDELSALQEAIGAGGNTPASSSPALPR